MACVFLPASNKSAAEEGARASNSRGQRMGEERFTQAAAERRGAGCDARRACNAPGRLPPHNPTHSPRICFFPHRGEFLQLDPSDGAHRVAGTSPPAIPWSCLGTCPGMLMEEPRTRRKAVKAPLSHPALLEPSSAPVGCATEAPATRCAGRPNPIRAEHRLIMCIYRL